MNIGNFRLPLYYPQVLDSELSEIEQFRHEKHLRQIPAASLDVIVCKIPRNCVDPEQFGAVVLNYREHHFSWDEEYLHTVDGWESLRLERENREGKFCLEDFMDPEFLRQVNISKQGLDPKKAYKSADEIREVLSNKILLQGGESVSFQDPAIYFQLKEGINNYTLWLDCFFRLREKGIFVPVLVPCYEGRGFDWDEMKICSEVNLESTSTLYCFSGESNKIDITGDRSIEQCKFILILMMELVFRESTIEFFEKGFTIFPLWTNGQCLTQSTFQLPLFDEELDDKALNYLKKQEDPYQLLYLMSKNSDKRFPRIEGSVVVRAIPDVLEPFLTEPYDVLSNNTCFLPDKFPEQGLMNRENLLYELEKVGEGELFKFFPDDYDPEVVETNLKKFVQSLHAENVN